MPGPAPKPASKRRRRTPPVSYGAATPTTAPAASPEVRELGIDAPHSLVERMWAALQISAESRFYSDADWQRVRLELFYANGLLTSDQPISGNMWAAVQHGLNELLISPAAKRRAAIEVRPVGPDADQDAAISMMSKYRSKLTSPSS